MAIIKYQNVGIRAIAACVPRKISSNYDLVNIIPKESLNKLINAIGIIEKRIADDDVCSSDLCYKAAKKLMEDNDIDPNSIDMLIFLTMTPDFISPPTSSILQRKLGLSKETACFDMSLACSGYVYSLSTAFAYASMNGINRVLLLVGETMSKLTNPNDKVNYPLYGDAGTATLIEKGDFSESIFNLTTDGDGEEFVKVPHGGFRNITTADSYVQKEREDGNIRRDVDITMDGMATFDHAVSGIPKGVRVLMNTAGISVSDPDFYVFHQANEFMIKFIMKRLKVDPDKAPFCLSKFGNTSCASIPLTIVSELEKKMNGEKKIFLSSIGAGWSFANAYLTTKDLKVSKLIEY